MKRNEVYDLVLGVAVVAIVYMVLKQTKSAKTKAGNEQLNQQSADIIGGLFDLPNPWQGFY